VPVVTGANDGIAECAFCVGSCKERFSDETKLRGVAYVVARLVSLESGGEFVGVVEDFLGGAGHGGHLRYFGRALEAKVRGVAHNVNAATRSIPARAWWVERTR
jgi:hypothetical protein